MMCNLQARKILQASELQVPQSVQHVVCAPGRRPGDLIMPSVHNAVVKLFGCAGQAVSVTADEDLPPELAEALKAEHGAALQASSLQMLTVRPSPPVYSAWAGCKTYSTCHMHLQLPQLWVLWAFVTSCSQRHGPSPGARHGMPNPA